MESWGQVPTELRRALTPVKMVRNSCKMLVRDYRMRIFRPDDSQCGAMYLCKQAHVDLADSSRSGTPIVQADFRDHKIFLTAV